MNDPQIREAFHRKVLQLHHKSADTLVINELGLEHGTCRADIAVVNGDLIGYEIKSDVDSLKRLNSQVNTYNAVFDLASIILTARHLEDAMAIVPYWWGIVLTKVNSREQICFEYLRSPQKNIKTKDYSIAQLLWRDEAQAILIKLGVHGAELRKNRGLLYTDIISMLTPDDLRYTVREYLKKRRRWRGPESPFLNDDLSRPHGNGTALQPS